MPLHSQYEALLSQLASAGGPALSDMPVSAGREMYRMMQPAAPDIEVGKVEDRKIPGPGGPIPVRIYTPKASPQNKGGPFPIFMNFHGGGWVIGDLDTADSQCRDVCPGGRRRLLRGHRLGCAGSESAQWRCEPDRGRWRQRRRESGCRRLVDGARPQRPEDRFPAPRLSGH
jgi:hypothetical protein